MQGLRNRLKRGDWSPGGFSAIPNLMLTLLLLGMMGVRGGDYAWGDSPKTAHRLSAVEAAMPLWVWGSILLGASTLGFISIFARRAWGIVWAHIIGWATYWAIAGGLIADVYARENDARLFDEIVTAALVVGAVVVLWSIRNQDSPVNTLTYVAITLTVAMVIASNDWDGLRNASALAGLGALNAIAAYGTASRAKIREIQMRG